MALSQIQIKPKRSGGGGLFGSILGKIAGGIAGAVAAPFTGGASIPAGIAAGSAIGGTAGGLIGSAVNKGGVSGGRGVPTLQSAAKIDPEVQRAQVVDALKAAQFLPPDQRDQITPTLNKANEELMKRIGVR